MGKWSLTGNNQLLIMRGAGKKERLYYVEMKLTGRDGMNLFPAVRKVCADGTAGAVNGIPV
jgi:hypothetical protein